MNEWWKQLYGESEGKDGKGIYPSAVDFSTDLHSMGQWIQEGERTISGYLLGVNPFNQPGVEAYKKNMFALLNKPGYEEESKAIQARL